jgi:hypothetical protein
MPHPFLLEPSSKILIVDCTNYARETLTNIIQIFKLALGKFISSYVLVGKKIPGTT